MTYAAPQNDIDALTLALILALTAPTRLKSQAAVKIANDISRSMTRADVERCKERALNSLNAMVKQ